MLNRRLVADNPEKIRDILKRRNANAQATAELDRLVSVIERRKSLQTETDQLRADRKSLSKQIGPLMKGGKHAEAEPIKAKVRAGAEKLNLLEEERKSLVAEEENLLLGLPNLLDDRVPTGSDEAANTIIRTWGTPKTFDFEAKEHDVLGRELGIFDMERAAKLSGSRFAILRGAGAKLERALINFFLDQATTNGPYQEVMVPYMVNQASMMGTGQLPKFGSDMFKISEPVNGNDAYLIPTAEVPVTNMHREEILNEDDLPTHYCAFTPCFRAEAGSHGRDTRGLIRQHQFHKVELVKITTPAQSDAEHEALTRHAETLLELLELPYRRMLLCSGDIGFGAQLCYDLEVWLPGQGKFREISSCSNYGAFQARRMKLRYRPAGGGKPQACHTINGSALAVGRTLVAILENYQQEDGSVQIPTVLQPYMGLDHIRVQE